MKQRYRTKEFQQLLFERYGEMPSPPTLRFLSASGVLRPEVTPRKWRSYSDADADRYGVYRAERGAEL
jgi:hypothetical protein